MKTAKLILLETNMSYNVLSTDGNNAAIHAMSIYADQQKKQIIQIIEDRIVELDLSDYSDTVRAYELNRLIKELKNEGKSN